MTAAFLQAELSSLISDAKRKHAEIKVAAEKSLSDLKAIAVTSETQLSGDLARKSYFIDPFILACKSQSAKLASTGAAALQRCVASTTVPRARLSDVLQAFEDAASLALDVQLKILQTLPSLLQLYAADLHGSDTLGRALSISSDLSASKNPIVNRTAAATFQQLVTAVFARISDHSKSSAGPADEYAAVVQDREDALAIFIDLCAPLTGKQTSFVRLDSLPPPAVLEVLETLLSSTGLSLLRDEQAVEALSTDLIPGICTLVESSSNYGVVVRAVRIAFVLGTSHLRNISHQLVRFLKIMLNFVDRPPAQKWKRILSLEFFRGICSSSETVRSMFMLYDLAEGHPNLIAELMASLVRIASEDPSLIGLGRQSTIPMSRRSNNTDAAATIDVPLSAIGHNRSSTTGISIEWSTVSTPCLDSFDRTVPLEVPETYIFTLVLGCIAAFSDGLSKFVMPLSMPTRRMTKAEEQVPEDIDIDDAIPKTLTKDASSRQKHQQLINPLTLKDSPNWEIVKVCAEMIGHCWPAVLAICSTFLNAALDSYFYHMLIRTVQKLTQVSGVLDLDTPRDALLTTLAKVSVPVNITGLLNTLYAGRTALVTAQDAQVITDEATIKSPTAVTPRQSIDLSVQHLNVRNLLCLRALLNLGIALGPTLSRASWLIILQSLQQVEALVSIGPNSEFVQSIVKHPEANEGGAVSILASEIAAVDTARRRMIESTKSYHEKSFETVCEALLQIVAGVLPDSPSERTKVDLVSSVSRPNPPTHRNTRNTSGQWAKFAILEVEVEFVLKTLGRMASVNLYRFQDELASTGPWNLVVHSLIRFQRHIQLLPSLRLQSARIIDAIIVEVCTSHDEFEDDVSDVGSIVATKYGIPALIQQLDPAQYPSSQNLKDDELVGKVVQALLETLQNVVGACGESLGYGWRGVFNILGLVITILDAAPPSTSTGALYGQAFKMTQLIISDFLPVLDPISVQDLLELFRNFASQTVDLNIALTTNALYWNVATMIIQQTEQYELEDPLTGMQEEVDSPPNLWSQIIFGLRELSKDIRSDVRNAALRMLAKVFDASLGELHPITLTSAVAQVWLALLTFFGQMSVSGSDTWQDSIIAVLEDLQQVVELRGPQLVEADNFLTLWQKIIQVVESILKVRELKTTFAIFRALTRVLSILRRSNNNFSFNTNDEAVHAIWCLWTTYCPADVDNNASNEEVVSAYASLVIEIADWRFDYLARSANAADQIATAIDQLIFATKHDQFTVDIRKLSVSQSQILRVIQLTKKLLAQTGIKFQSMVLSLTDRMVRRNLEVIQKSQPTSNGTRVPSNIALVTACIEELRQDVQSKRKLENPGEHMLTADIMVFSINLVNKTKYSAMPVYDENPLWQQACSLGVETMSIVRDQSTSAGKIWSEQHHPPASYINALARAIITTPHLEGFEPNKRLSVSQLEKGESFDMTQLKRLHSVSIDIFHSPNISEVYLKTYALLLFRQSLVAEPWYNDLTPDLEVMPLKDLTTIRGGSIRSPLVAIRRRMHLEVLDCLFDLVSCHHKTEVSPPAISIVAAPYVVLRLAHALKTFIADQPLRHLEEPHPALQRELHVVLKGFVDLRVVDTVFLQVAEDLGSGTPCLETIEHEGDARDPNGIIKADGKAHLRLMFPLMVKFEEVWHKMPRLDLKHLSWQAGEDGRAVERCLREWRELVSVGWGPSFA